MIKRISPLIVLLLSACATMVWTKPGASQNDFSRDKFTCLQQAQQRVSSANVNAYGGTANNTVVTNDAIFSSCMNSNGWYLKTQDAARQQQQQQVQQQQTQQSTQQQQQQEKNQRIKAVFDQLATESRAACEKEENKPIYARSACKLDDVSLEQLADNKKISPTEKAVFLSIHSESKARGKRASANYKSIGDSKGFEISTLIDKTEVMTETNALALYEGSITWGQYNKRRKEIAQVYKDEFNQIVRPK